MANITIRNLDDDTHAALKARARRHGRSMEAEIRHVLTEVTLKRSVQPVTAEQLKARLKTIMDEAGGGLKPNELRLPPRDTRLRSSVSFD